MLQIIALFNNFLVKIQEMFLLNTGEFFTLVHQNHQFLKGSVFYDSNKVSVHTTTFVLKLPFHLHKNV